MRTRHLLLAAIAAAALTGSLAVSPAAHASTTLQAVTTLTGRPDSGGGGTWAGDNLTRTLIITQTAPGTYTATVSDNGTFTALAGALTPDQGGADAGEVILSGVTGSAVGGASYSFTASAAPDMSLVPASEDGAPAAPEQTTSLWFEQAFPAGTVFGGPGITDWSWAYSTAHSLRPPHSLAQTWTDALGNGGGQDPGSGNILGY